jgi:hypothetical protein
LSDFRKWFPDSRVVRQVFIKEQLLEHPGRLINNASLAPDIVNGLRRVFMGKPERPGKLLNTLRR